MTRTHATRTKSMRPLASPQRQFCQVTFLAIATAVSGLSAQTTLAAPPQDAQQTPEFTLRANARLTIVDVTAFDSRENQIHGLPETAFTVLEDGKPMTIKSFSEIGKATPLVVRTPPKLPPDVHTNLQPPPTTSAVNILLIDALNTGTAEQVFIKDETTKFIKGMQPGTRIAIMSLGAKLRLLQGFTSDPEILLAAVNTKKNRSLPSPFIDSSSEDIGNAMMDLASDDVAAALTEFQNEQSSFQTDMRNRMTLEALNQIAAYLSGIKGRKNLIWFTAGVPLQMFPQGGRDDLAAMTDYSRDIRRTTDLLTAAQVSIYPVDATGVTTLPTASVVSHPPAGAFSGKGDAMGTAIQANTMKNAQSHLAMEAIAEATGGIAYYNTNGLKEAVNKAIENGQNYYTISYVPPDPNFDGKFHRITVKVANPGVHLAYRTGYYSDDIARNEITPGLTLATAAPEPYGTNMAASMGRGVPTSSQILFTLRVDPQSDSVNPPDTKTVGNLDPKLHGKPLRRYVFSYSVPAAGRQLIFKQDADKSYKGTVEFDIAAYDVYGKLITSISQTMNLGLTPDRFQQFQNKPLQLVQALDLPLGETFVRAGILDAVADKTGTLEVPLEVTRKP